jgi:hypothetical protein
MEPTIITRDFPEVTVPGLLTATVPGNLSTNLFIQAKDPFTPESFSIPEDIAQDFLITDIKVGANSQFISTGCIPALLFSDEAVVERLRLDHLPTAKLLKISVTNQATGERQFKASVSGPASPVSQPNPRWRTLVGLGSTMVHAGAVAAVYVQPQLNFAPDRLVVPSSIGERFQVLDIRTTGLDGLVWESMRQSFSATDFSKKKAGKVRLKEPVLSEIFLSIQVKNISNTACNFQGTFVGEAVALDGYFKKT